MSSYITIREDLFMELFPTESDAHEAFVRLDGDRHVGFVRHEVAIIVRTFLARMLENNTLNPAAVRALKDGADLTFTDFWKKAKPQLEFIVEEFERRGVPL